MNKQDIDQFINNSKTRICSDFGDREFFAFIENIKSKAVRKSFIELRKEAKISEAIRLLVSNGYKVTLPTDTLEVSE